MGKQVNFYMLPEDIEEFDTFARGTGNVTLVSSRSISSSPAVLKGQLVEETNELSMILLWNRSITDELILQRISGPVESYWVDKLRSEVVEFVRPAVSEGRLERGRIWAEMMSHDENFELVPKSPDFCKWYDSLARWIRKRYKRLEGCYAGPAAQRWVQSGGELR